MSTSSRPWLPFVSWTAAVVLAILLATLAVRVPSGRDGSRPGTRSDGGAEIASSTTAAASNDPAADANATSMAAFNHQLVLDAGGAYPGPGTQWPTPVPPTATPTATATPDVRPALPDGAVVDDVSAWSAQHAVVATYRLDGAAAVAVVSGDGRRTLWDSRGEAVLPGHAAHAFAVGRMPRGAAAKTHLALALDDVAALLVLDVAADGTVKRQLYRVGASDVKDPARQAFLSLTTTAASGDARTAVVVTQADDALGQGEALVVYGDGDVPPVLGRFDGPLEVRDVDGDGTDEIVQPDGAGGWTARRGADDYAAAEPFPATSVTDAVAPPVVVPADGALPPLPAELCFVRQEAIVCWPAAGGALETIWAPSDEWSLVGTYPPQDAPSVGAWRFAAGGRRLVMAQTHTVGAVSMGDGARLLVVDRDSGTQAAIELPRPWRNDVTGGGRAFTDWSVDATGSRVVYLERAIDEARQESTGDAEVRVVDLEARAEGIAAGTARTVAHCNAARRPAGEGDAWCYGVSLAPDGAVIAMSDGSGLALVDVPSGDVRRVAEHVNRDSDGWAWKAYEPMEWSPDGRWLHLVVGHYEGSSDAWVDRAGDIVREVPNSHSYAGSESSLAFGADRIAHAHAQAEAGGYLSLLDPTAGELWRMPRVSIGQAQTNAFDPIIVGDEVRFGMTRSMYGGPSDHAVFSLTLGDHATEPRRLASLPRDVLGPYEYLPTPDLAWAGDGSAYVLLGVVGRDEETDGRDVALIGAETHGGWRSFDASAVLAGASGVMWSGR